MFVELVGGIGRTAIDIVKARFPKEFYQIENSHTIFELVEMVGDELVKKNSDIFFKPYFNQFVDVKDLKFGDEYDCVFYTEEEEIKHGKSNCVSNTKHESIKVMVDR